MEPNRPGGKAAFLMGALPMLHSSKGEVSPYKAGLARGLGDDALPVVSRPGLLGQRCAGNRAALLDGRLNAYERSPADPYPDRQEGSNRAQEIGRREHGGGGWQRSGTRISSGSWCSSAW